MFSEVTWGLRGYCHRGQNLRGGGERLSPICTQASNNVHGFTPPYFPKLKPSEQAKCPLPPRELTAVCGLNSAAKPKS